jgi:hypothetical protein
MANYFNYGTQAILTCIHQENKGQTGLCRHCQDEYAADPEAYLEYGDHREGIARWEEMERLMNECHKGETEPRADYKPNHDFEIPF